MYNKLEVKTDVKNTKTPLEMSNRSKIVPGKILKTGAVQVQQIKYRNIILQQHSL